MRPAVRARLGLIIALIYAAMLFQAVGCGIGSRTWAGDSSIWDYTVIVTNTTGEQIRVGDQFGSLGALHGSERRCFRLHTPSQNAVLWWKRTAEQRKYTVPLDFFSIHHWEWTIGQSDIDNAIAPVPAWGPCEVWSPSSGA